MVRCCGHVAEEGERQCREMTFPMWVIPVGVFLEMAAGPPLCHQRLKAAGKLVQWTSGMFILFVSHQCRLWPASTARRRDLPSEGPEEEVAERCLPPAHQHHLVSHQWVGHRHCDPNGEQMEVLRSFLRGVISGTLQVRSGLVQFLIHQKLEGLSPQHRQKIKNGFIWLDWASIPQLSMRTGDEPGMEEDVQHAIESIPAYADASDLFLVLCPPVRHVDTKEICGHETWASRGWCRLEMAAAAFSEMQKPLVMIDSGSSAFLMFMDEHLQDSPGRGQFTDDEDRAKLLPVMEGILEKHLEALWKTPTQNVRARFLTALRRQLLSGLSTGSSEPMQSNMAQFLKDFRFDSPIAQGEAGFGPVHCAAIDGNMTMLRLLVAAKADVNQPITKDVPELRFIKGSTPLLQASRDNGDVKVIQCLIDLRADVQARNALGHGPLHHSAAADQLELTRFWLDQGQHVDYTGSLLGDTPLLAAALLGKSAVMELLLERRANVHAVSLFGTTPLMSAVVAGRPECVQLLLKHGADAHAKCWPKGLKGEAVGGLMRLASLGFPRQGPVGTFMRLRGKSPLEVASILGFADILELLASPPPVQSTARGYTVSL